MHLLLNLYLLTTILLSEDLPVLPDLGLLDLYCLDLRSFKSLLYALLLKLGRLLGIQGLELAVLVESIRSDL